MGRTTLLTLGAVALALATYLALGGRPAEPPASTRLINSFARDRVTRLTISAHGRAAIRLRRQDGGWWLESPVRGRAETARVDQILSAVEFLEPRRWIGSAQPSKLTQYGLRPPRLELELAGADGVPQHQVQIGAADPSGGATYLRLQGEEVCVVSGELARLVDVEAAELRARSMVALTAAEIERLSLSRGGVRSRLARRDGSWWVTTSSGLLARGHEGRIQRLLGRLSGLVARSFPGAPSGKPAVQLELEIAGRHRGGARRAHLRLAGRCPGRADRRLLARRERWPAPDKQPEAGGPWLWTCVDAEAAKALLVEDASLLERRVTGLTASRLAKIRVAAGGRKLTLERRGGAWRMGAGEADPDVVARWVEALGVPGELAPAEPELIARLSRGATEVILEEEGGQRERILLARRPSGRSAVWREGEKAVLWVSTAGLPPLDGDPLHFRSREVLSLPRFAVAKIETLHFGAGGQLTWREVVARVADGRRSGFAVAAPVALPADDEHVAALLDRLGNLRAVRFAPAGSTPVGPKSARTEIVVQLEGEVRGSGQPRQRRLPNQRKLIVERAAGAGMGGPCWAAVVGGPRFELAGADCGLLVRLRGSRRPAHRVDPSALRRIRVEGELGTRDFVRRDLTWYEGAKLADPGTVARLVERLARAEGELIGYGGSPAVARTKIMLELDGRTWKAAVGPADRSGRRTLAVLGAKGSAEQSYRLSLATWKGLREALGSRAR